jgi:hypothetical protein
MSPVGHSAALFMMAFEHSAMFSGFQHPSASSLVFPRGSLAP